MNVKTTIATISILSALSFGVFAADSINDNQATNLKPMGTITVSGINGAPSDIRQALSDKADAMGATAYKVIEARADNNWHATAEIYQ
ncbi:peroxide/acid stress response protein YhcN [Yersinia frederiksenii]|uniref:peroxide/acid stress response protein YhcN n=1 Tax=Yersinia frederiksenii TaxID=29484 RepID=UPI0005DE6271|nr:peroxide/acid stress response protein YhcN [Yersinia frederiksenii]CNE90560.1 Multiple stress resistance protein BhsA precursor [Yersinia frederiksenii]